ncbi:scopoletin glucosyltransferase-like [Dorcoceras hygrometricum]|uniref:Scopoletin glucosyltransferase-like n=1 Tax=Dorcoceras hygrometricum TaxID=472368 RepID=A0A2Z7ADF4_9LAMI|nr:scopoletin glucosyltransferase-like [Dorcoceras hygrometricum]
MSASGESSTTMHRLLHVSRSHPIPPPNDPNTTKTSDLSTRQINDLESSNECSSIDHQKQAASKKRPTVAAVGEPVLKNKRTMKKKSGSSQENLEIVLVAQEEVPIQIIEPIPAAPVVEPSMEEQREATSAVPINEDISAVEQPADVETIVEAFDESSVEGTAEEIRPPSTDDVDNIIEQVLTETVHFEADEEDNGVGTSDVGDQPAGAADDSVPWNNLPYEVLIARDSERVFETASDTDDEEMETIDVGDQQLQTVDAAVSRADAAADYFVEEPVEETETEAGELSADEAKSIEDILMTIPVDVPLPSAGVEITKITLGKDIKIPGVDERTCDHCVKIPKPIVHNEVPRQLSYEDTLPAISTFFKFMKKRWADVCLAVGEFFVSGKLLPVDGRTLDDVQTLCFNEFRKGFVAHSAVVTTDSMDFRKELRALNAKVTSLDEQVAATRNDLLEFSAQAQETLNHITDQLSELIAYINRGGNDKKGEVSSSRPQPPPDDQNRGSGNTSGGSGARTTDIVDRFSGSLSREGRGRGSGGSRSRGHYKKRYPSIGGGQFRRSFDDCIG